MLRSDGNPVNRMPTIGCSVVYQAEDHYDAEYYRNEILEETASPISYDEDEEIY